MPYEVRILPLPCGAHFARVDAHGIITAEDARAQVSRMDQPEGDLYGLPTMFVTQQMESMTPKVRAIFSARRHLGEKDPWVAVVVANVMIRVFTQFVMRARGSKKTRVFTREGDAVAWLNDRVVEGQAAKPPEP